MCRNKIIRIPRWLLPGWFLISFSPGRVSAAPPYNAWLRFTADYRLTPRWQVAMEFQHRRQSGYDNADPLRYPQLYSVRPWLYYRLSGGIRLETSPLAFYAAYNAIRQVSDKSRSPGKEWRTSLGLTADHKLYDRLVLHSRSLWEFRYWSSESHRIRMRASLGLSYETGSGIKALVREEILFNLSGMEPGQIFDQERWSVALSKQCCARLDMEIGYLYLSRWQAPETPLRKEQDLYINLTYHLR